MRWPNPTDYQDAVQNPRFCFQDPELKAGIVALLPMGLPRVASGNFASVYEMQSGKKRWAVRCFLRQGADQQRHYGHVSQHLKELWLPFLVDFAYQPEGIRVLGQTYPIVKMQWVDGVALHSYVKKHLKRPQNLLRLAAQWRGLVNSLQGSGLAHGDLQHGNVLVTSKGVIRLVDYDAMYVPALHGTNCAELGHANYQHPQRQGANYDAGLDNFSALVIYTALRALAADPGLWDTFHTGENLLFSSVDFKKPAYSDVFGRLRHVSDPAVPALARELETWCCNPFAHIGSFENVTAAALHKAASFHDAKQAFVPQVGAATVNTIVTNAASANASQPITPATPIPSAPPPVAPPNRWWMSAVPAQSQPVKLPVQQPASAPTKPSAIPFAAPKQTPTAAPIPKPGQIKINPVDGAEMVWIPEGEFIMGTNNVVADNFPQRSVWLSGFWMYKFAVTVAQYEAFCTATTYSMPPKPTWGWQSKHPIVNVDWNDANAYCQWAGVRLPTEAQWEKAARGTDGRVYPWGNVWDDKKCCGHRMSSARGNTPVFVGDCASGASPYGMLNMVGNVWEWCFDWYGANYYAQKNNHNPSGPASGIQNILRGGSWQNEKDALCTTYRDGHLWGMRMPRFGFRCAAP